MDNMVARETAFLVLTVLSLTVAKVDSIGLLVRICCQRQNISLAVNTRFDYNSAELGTMSTKAKRNIEELRFLVSKDLRNLSDELPDVD
jgi:hypothetical protein